MIYEVKKWWMIFDLNTDDLWS